MCSEMHKGLLSPMHCQLHPFKADQLRMQQTQPANLPQPPMHSNNNSISTISSNRNHQQITHRQSGAQTQRQITSLRFGRTSAEWRLGWGAVNNGFSACHYNSLRCVQCAQVLKNGRIIDVIDLSSKPL